MIPVPKEDRDSQYLIMATRHGLIKKTALSAFRNIRRSGLIAVNLQEGDALIGAELIEGGDVMLGSRQGQAIRFSDDRIRATSRTSMGVRSMRLDDGDEIISLASIEEGAQVLVVTENGYGKRSEAEEYRVTDRGGKGV